MKTNLMSCLSLITALAAIPSVGSTAPTHTPGPSPHLRATLTQLPLRFEPNRGQTNKEVAFLARGLNYSLFLTPREAVLVLPNCASRSQAPRTDAPVVHMKLLGMKPHPQIRGRQPLPGHTHYYLGNTHTQTSHFAQVEYKNVYPGINLVYYGNQSQLEYDFTLAPGADPKAIRLGFSGVKEVRINPQGDLLLTTPQGEFRQHKPLLYQSIGEKRQAVAGRYVLLGGHQVGFAVASYDRTQPLVIDPVVHCVSYLGGSSADIAWGVGMDALGCAYITGDTLSSDFPRQNAFTSTGTGRHDVFVTKLNAAGTGIAYSTYFGGSFIDRGTAIAVDSVGNAYVTGSTSSTDFITTVGAYRRTSGGGSSDAFVTKISPSGALLYSTYLGGNGTEEGYGIGIDALGNAVVTGKTSSTNYPTQSALQTSRRGSSDAFVSKLNALGSALLYSTYLGGDGGEDGYAIAVQAVTGDAYVTGDTASTNFPVTSGAFQTSNRGATNAFVAKFSATGSRVYATYLGGSGGDTGYGIAVDATGCAYVTGSSCSVNFPLAQAIDSSNISGDAFVTKLNASGSGLVYSTYLGGSGGDTGRGIALDAAGNAIVTGSTISTNFPVVNALQPTYGGGNSDGFLAMLSVSGTQLVYSSYFGGSGSDYSNALAVDPLTGSAYIAGETWSTDLHVWDAFQTTKRSLDDGFIAQFDSLGVVDPNPPTVNITSPSNSQVIAGSVAVQASASDNVGVACVDFYVDNVKVATSVAAPYSYSWNTAGAANSSHSLRAVALDGAGNSASSQISVTVNNGISDTTPPTVSFNTMSNGSFVRSTRTIGATASDNVGVASVDFYIDNVLVATDTAAPYSYTWYTTSVADGSHTLRVVAKDAAGNSASAQITVTVDNTLPTVSITSPGNGATVGGTITIQASASDNIGISSVRFYIDGVLKSSDTLAPYSYSWITTTVANGSHTIRADAIDKAGNTRSAQISVTVSN